MFQVSDQDTKARCENCTKLKLNPPFSSKQKKKQKEKKRNIRNLRAIGFMFVRLTCWEITQATKNAQISTSLSEVLY